MLLVAARVLKASFALHAAHAPRELAQRCDERAGATIQRSIAARSSSTRSGFVT
jgi:hypothetical protein